MIRLNVINRLKIYGFVELEIPDFKKSRIRINTKYLLFFREAVTRQVVDC